MKKKKVFTTLGFILIFLIIGCLAFYFIKNHSNHSNTPSEYIPQEEMSDDEIRKTIVSLYFKNIETNTLTPETVCIDVKELSENPYSKLINLLLAGPSNEKLECALPENTKLNNAYIEGNTVYVDFSPEFINNAPAGIEEEGLIVYSIVNTLTELNEVESVKFLINGEKDLCFKDNAFNFKESFVRNN